MEEGGKRAPQDSRELAFVPGTAGGADEAPRPDWPRCAPARLGEGKAEEEAEEDAHPTKDYQLPPALPPPLRP